MPTLSSNDQKEAELIQHIFYGKLDNLPTLASKIVRIFTSSTFTGKFVCTEVFKIIHLLYLIEKQIYLIFLKLYYRQMIECDA